MRVTAIVIPSRCALWGDTHKYRPNSEKSASQVQN
jgi:hypothetical protein